MIKSSFPRLWVTEAHEEKIKSVHYSEYII
jgi:hypothetical protein